MSDEAAVTQALTGYYAAFSTLDVEAIMPYFHEPSMLIGPQGVFAASVRAELAVVFTPAMDGFRARGFVRSELRLEELRVLSATAASARGIAVRYKTDGSELDRAGVSYLLHKAATDWKIAVVVVHDVR